jgi:hypothetical protein
MNAIVNALQVGALRIHWRRTAVIALVAVAGSYAAYRLAIAIAFKDENRPAGEEIVAALEAYKAANKRYPERLASLQPKYLGKIPAPAPGTNFVYAIPTDGRAAWFGYQTLRGVFSEYDSQSRTWQDIDYDDSQALRQLTKEFVMGRK